MAISTALLLLLVLLVILVLAGVAMRSVLKRRGTKSNVDPYEEPGIRTR